VTDQYGCPVKWALVYGQQFAVGRIGKPCTHDASVAMHANGVFVLTLEWMRQSVRPFTQEGLDGGILMILSQHFPAANVLGL